MKPSALLKAHSRGSFARLLFESQMCNGPFLTEETHIKRSLLYRFIQVCILCLRLITPSAFLILFLVLLNEASHWFPTIVFDALNMFVSKDMGNMFQDIFSINYLLLQPLQHPLATFVTLYLIAEVIFFFYYYYLFTQIAHANDDLHHYAHDRPARLQLARDCFEALSLTAQTMNITPHIYLRAVIQSWFMEVPLVRVRYGNIFAWCAWAFFGRDPKDLDEHETADNKDIVALLAHMAQWSFPPGFCSETPPMRLNLDPIFVTQRPFFLYLMIFCINVSSMLIVRGFLGFSLSRKHSAEDGSQRIYFRAASEEKQLSWVIRLFLNIMQWSELWLIKMLKRMRVDPFLVEELHQHHVYLLNKDKEIREHGIDTHISNETDKNKKRKLPVVFVHGIGIGLGMYLKLLVTLPWDTDVFLVEWPYVAMQMTMNAPRAEEAVASLLAALTERNHSQCCVVAHSLGTVMMSWLCRAHNTRCFQSAIARSDEQHQQQLARYNNSNKNNSNTEKKHKKNMFPRLKLNPFYSNTKISLLNTLRPVSSNRGNNAMKSNNSNNNNHRGSVMLNSDVIAYDAPGVGVVAASIILDPISFLLFDPTVASVFVYKDPKDALDLCMHYFLSRELFIANALSRHFVWTYNVMFPEDLETHRPCCDRLRRISRREKWLDSDPIVETSTLDPILETSCEHSLPSTPMKSSTPQKDASEGIYRNTRSAVKAKLSSSILKLPESEDNQIRNRRSLSTKNNNNNNNYSNKMGMKSTESEDDWMMSHSPSPSPRTNPFQGTTQSTLSSMNNTVDGNKNVRAEDLHVNPLLDGIGDEAQAFAHADSRAEEAEWLRHLKESHVSQEPFQEYCRAQQSNSAAGSTTKIIPPRHSVILSSEDSIVPTEKVLHYLTHKIESGCVTSLEVKVAQGPHGAMLTQPQWLIHIAQRLQQKLDVYYQEDTNNEL